MNYQQEQIAETATIRRKPYDREDANIYEQSWCALARKDFWTFRLMMRPALITGWWQMVVADNLTMFWRDFCSGKRPKLVLGAPPQHGKSDTMKDFAAWVAGNDPSLRILFASYADELGISANLHLQRMMSTPAYQAVFPDTRLSEYVRDDPDRSRRTTTFLEFVKKGGSFRNTTIAGKITGFGLDVGIIDDPIKGRAEAQSQLIRDKTWSWLTDDFFSRFSDRGAMVMIQTRWHVDDPTGRWLERFPNTRVLNFKAIATRKEKYRNAGEALFPKLKSIAFLEERRKTLTESSWEALYQQSPFVVGGGMFPVEKLQILPWLDRDKVMRSVRFWDKAGTENAGAHTAGVLMHELTDRTFVVEHVARGQWGALERENRIKQWAHSDRERCHNYEVGVEQEPGSGGKESAEATIRNLAGFNCYAERPTGPKEVRAELFAAQVQGSNVWLCAGGWHRDYLDELECCVAGTLVTTIAGAKAIEHVHPGELVMTRLGWRRVLRSGCTSQRARACEILLSNGRRLRVTLNHPIFVPGFGFKSAGRLEANESLLQFTGISNLDCTRTGVVTFQGWWTDAIRNCTAIFGSKRRANCLQGITSTIAMVIQRIMCWVTWNAFQRANIINAIPNLAIGSIEKKSLALSAVQFLWPVAARQSTALFIAGTKPFQGAIAISASKNYARFVERPTSGLRNQKVAASVAERLWGGVTASVMWLANGARKNSIRPQSKDFAACIAVSAISMLPGEHAVYNLEVEEAHEYVAEGVLVHNCFPNGVAMDQVDASSGAFNRLVAGAGYGIMLPGLYE